jgi:hypothetical protein
LASDIDVFLVTWDDEQISQFDRGLATMSGMRNRTIADRYNPSDHGLSDSAKKKRDKATPCSTRSKSGSLKQTDRFDPDWEGRNDKKIKIFRGETPGPTDAQEALA